MSRYQRRPIQGNSHTGPVRYIPDEDRHERLKKALAYTAEGSKLFVQDLIDKHATFGGWTVNQSPYVDQMLERARENYRRVHGKKGATPLREPRVSPEGMRGLKRLFDRAADADVRKAQILLLNAKIKPHSRDIGAFAVYSRSDAYIGKLDTLGELRSSHADPKDLMYIAHGLSRLGEDPMGAATLFSDHSGLCMLCGGEGGLHGLCAGRYGVWESAD